MTYSRTRTSDPSPHSSTLWTCQTKNPTPRIDPTQAKLARVDRLLAAGNTGPLDGGASARNASASWPNWRR